jgi:outer membrane cobalamin receptor
MRVRLWTGFAALVLAFVGAGSADAGVGAAPASPGVGAPASPGVGAATRAGAGTVARPEIVKGKDGALDTLFTVPAIVVRADRVRRDEYDVFMKPGFVAVIDPGERKDRVEDLSSVLSQVVGVRVRQYGGLGSFATVSIRGSSSNQVDLYLDGMPLGDSYTGTSNLGDLPLDGISSIEVYRGFSPPHIGSSSIGGVINLRTDTGKGTGGPAAIDTEARVSYGSFETSRYAVSLWPSRGRVRAFLQGSYLDTEGNFEFLDDKGTPENPYDDEETLRVNNDSETIDFIGRVDVYLSNAGKLSLGNNTVLRENGVPGIGSYQSQSARTERARQITYLKYDAKPLFAEKLETSANGFFSTGNEKFRDLEGEIGLARQDTDNDFRSYGGNVRSTARLSPLTIELFLEGKSELFRPRSNIPTPTEGPDRTRDSYSAVISGDLVVEKADLVLTATERFHSYTSEFYDPPRFPWLPPQPQGEVRSDEATPQFGFRWLPTTFLTIKGNWAETYRVPTFLELFGNSGSVTGASDLVPESGVNRDIGAVVSLDRVGAARSVFLEVVYLDNKVENLILFFPNSQFTSRPTNIGAARIKGWEVSFSTLLAERVRLGGNYTYLDGKDTGPIPYYNGNDLPGRPKNDAAVFAEYVHRAGRLTYEYHRIGSNYLDPANQMKVPARNLHNIALRLDLFGSGASFTIEGRNLGDDRVSDVNGFPLPGRSYFMTLGYRN